MGLNANTQSWDLGIINQILPLNYVTYWVAIMKVRFSSHLLHAIHTKSSTFLFEWFYKVALMKLIAYSVLIIPEYLKKARLSHFTLTSKASKADNT